MEAATLNSSPLALQARAAQLFGGKLAISAEQAAEALECSARHIRRLVQQGHLQGVSLSASKRAGKRISVISLLNFLDTGGVSDEQDCPAVRLAADQRRHAKDLL